jgi:hypothetical protein
MGTRNKPCRRRLAILIGIASLLYTCSIERTATAAEDPYSVQAVLCTKFAKYAAWEKPDPAIPSNEYVIGIVGPNPFGKLLKDKVTEGRNVRVVLFKDAENIGPCHLLYINLEKQEEIKAVLDSLGKRCVMTAAFQDGFLKAGGIVQFVRATEKQKKETLRIAVNAPAAMRVGIKLSAPIQKHALKPTEVK